MYQRQSRRQHPHQVYVPRPTYAGRDLYGGHDLYAYPEDFESSGYEFETAPQSFYAPSARPAAAYGHDASPYYGYESYEPVSEPSAMDVLDWEEQQLLAQEARLANERKRLASEKRRLQAAAAEQERIRQWKVNEAREARRQQAARQQQAAEARRQQQIQQQIRQRQLTAQKEAQLEAALRELDASPAHPQIAQPIKHCICPNHARGQTAKNSPKRESAPTAPQHPLGWILRAFIPESTSQEQAANQAPKSRPASPKSAASPSFAPSAAPSSSTSYSEPKPTANTNTKRSEPTDLVQKLKERITAAAKKVGDLISTQFDQLSLRQFSKIDGELMQILLALDNIADSNKTERKALVKETMDLLAQVDQHKDDFSRSSSEDSSSHTSEMEVSEPEEVVEDIDADSNASDVEAAAPALSSVSVHIEPAVEEEEVESEHAQDEESDEEEVFVSEASPESNAMDVSDEVESEVLVEENVEEEEQENDADDENEEIEDFELLDSVEPSSAENLEASYAQPLEATTIVEEEEVPEESAPETVESAPIEEDPFGFNKIHAASKSEPTDLQRSSVPIQIGGARKATVSIETAPASSH